MTTFKIRISDRECSKFDVVDSYSLQVIPTPKNLDPIKSKLCNQDIFKIEDDTVKILHSSVRSMGIIPGILILNDSKTYGKVKGRCLYKCIPDDRRLPIFLVPHKVKITFSKNMINKYIVFKFKSWEGKHPIATLVNALGDVKHLDHFYEYQLYCKSLYASIQNITKKAMKKLKEKTEQEYIELIRKDCKLEDYRDSRHIFSIDPMGSKDFDDAFDIEKINEEETRVSIYISNVSIWMDAMDLWDSFSNRISTIYLPDRKRPMLPTVLSDALCSLTENDVRFVFELYLIVNTTTGEIKNVQFKNAIIKLERNLRYDTQAQEEYPLYKQLFKIVKLMNQNSKYLDSIDSSHDLVAYLMITMNYISAKRLMKYELGIYRSAKFDTTFQPPKEASKKIQKFLKNWNSSGGAYSKFGKIESHDMLALDAYVHITSPIRRMPDMLNIMILQEKEGLYNMSIEAKKFYNYWTSDSSLEYINVTMRSIRKVQNDCSLLKICTDDISILQNVYDGFIFDKILRNDSLFQYMVYLPELKMANRFTSRYDKKNLSNQKFKLYFFIDEHSLRKKIRVEIQ